MVHELGDRVVALTFKVKAHREFLRIAKVETLSRRIVHVYEDLWAFYQIYDMAERTDSESRTDDDHEIDLLAGELLEDVHKPLWEALTEECDVWLHGAVTLSLRCRQLFQRLRILLGFGWLCLAVHDCTIADVLF